LGEKEGNKLNDTAQVVSTIVSVIIGYGGIASDIVALLSVRKYKAEAAVPLIGT
jgi:hypothetical protein